MAFYENTLIAKQDLAEKDLKEIKDKYNKSLINLLVKLLKLKNGDC